MISFKTTKTESSVIAEIADRASAMALQKNLEYSARDCMMDITVTHANGSPLRLTNLLAADPVDFAHDVFGIRRYLNRATGQLEDCFVPRYTYNYPGEREG